MSLKLRPGTFPQTHFFGQYPDSFGKGGVSKNNMIVHLTFFKLVHGLYL